LSRLSARFTGAREVRVEMGAKSSLLTGAAGEHYVLYQLHLRGLLAAQSPRGAYAADVAVFSPAMGTHYRDTP
jgi:hypothetical protein